MRAPKGDTSLGRWGTLKDATANGYNFLFMSSGLEAVESNTDIITVNGTLGEPVTFPLCIQELQQVTNIAWMNSKTSVALIVVSDSGAAPQVTVTHENYYERINVSHQSYNLEISNLRMEDAGIYKADINIKTSKMRSTITRSYSLQVYRKLWEDRGMLIAAQFTIAKYWKQPKCPSANEWIQKLWYIYTMEGLLLFLLCKLAIKEQLYF